MKEIKILSLKAQLERLYHTKRAVLNFPVTSNGRIWMQRKNRASIYPRSP